MKGDTVTNPDIAFCQMLDHIENGVSWIHVAQETLEGYGDEGYRKHGETWNTIKQFQYDTVEYANKVADLWEKWRCDDIYRSIDVESRSEAERRKFERGD